MSGAGACHPGVLRITRSPFFFSIVSQQSNSPHAWHAPTKNAHEHRAGHHLAKRREPAHQRENKADDQLGQYQQGTGVVVPPKAHAVTPSCNKRKFRLTRGHSSDSTSPVTSLSIILFPPFFAIARPAPAQHHSNHRSLEPCSSVQQVLSGAWRRSPCSPPWWATCVGVAAWPPIPRHQFSQAHTRLG